MTLAPLLSVYLLHRSSEKKYYESQRERSRNDSYFPSRDKLLLTSMLGAILSSVRPEHPQDAVDRDFTPHQLIPTL